MKKKNNKEMLVTQGAEVLADALIELAGKNDRAAQLIGRLTADQDQASKGLRRRLAGFKRRESYVDWREAPTFLSELTYLLDDIKATIGDSKEGIALLSDFFRLDDAVLGICDDSYGNVGDVFRRDAVDLYLHYGRQCEDKPWLEEQLFDLLVDDSYSLRMEILDGILEILPSAQINSLVDRFWGAERLAKDKHQKRLWVCCLEAVAEKTSNPVLYEKAKLHLCQDDPPFTFKMDIAKVWLASGNAATALKWIKSIGDIPTHGSDDFDKLALKIGHSVGDQAWASEISWRWFRRHRSVGRLEQLLEIIGENQRSSVIEQTKSEIMGSQGLSYEDVQFLLDLRFDVEAEDHLANHQDQLNGGFYWSLLPLGEKLEQKGRFFGATLCFRALLDSILKRGQPETYGHGANYLKRLNLLAAQIQEWGRVPDHSTYRKKIADEHGRKSKFWSTYGGAPLS